MEIIIHHQQELIEKLKTVKLKGFGQPLIYTNCNITITEVPSESCLPAQFYYLKPRVAQIIELRRTIMDMYPNDPSMDILRLGIFNYRVGYLTIVLPDGTKIPFLPPVIEQFGMVNTYDPDSLICDGIHRVQAAIELRIPPRVIYITKPDFPYYALPNPGGWKDVQAIDELEEGFHKKNYRIRDKALYKQLFRDFNTVFPGVQEDRPKGLV